MTNKELIDKIRAEIERRIKIQDDWIEKGLPVGNLALAVREELKQLLSFLNTLSEEPNKSLEEAAEEAATGLNLGSHLRFIEGFKAGAEWKESQMPMPEDTVLFQKGVAEGRRLEREDVLNDAVEATVKEDAGGYPYIDMDIPLAKRGDKVRIVVLKNNEDESK